MLSDPGRDRYVRTKSGKCFDTIDLLVEDAKSIGAASTSGRKNVLCLEPRLVSGHRRDLAVGDRDGSIEFGQPLVPTDGALIRGSGFVAIEAWTGRQRADARQSHDRQQSGNADER